MQNLACYACYEQNSKGRVFVEPDPQYRTQFQRDRDRVIHSGAFRRLEYKTQVFVNHEGDMFRTRLTHSIEVAQIGRTIARVLKLNEDLTEAICLAHDLGHTPFGHAGQDALNECMRDYGGFEHNFQSLRVVDKLEERYADFPGLNLTFETREGILKHCSRSRARALGAVGERFIQGGQPSLEAQVANLADSIAYNNHDLDDGLRAGLIALEALREQPLFARHFNSMSRKSKPLPLKRLIYETIRRMINEQVVSLVETSLVALQTIQPDCVDAVRQQSKPLIRLGEQAEQGHQSLKKFLHQALYRHYRVHRMSFKAQRIIRALFLAFMQDPGLLPNDVQHKITAATASADACNDACKARMIADYIAGMTDRFAIKEYEKLFSPLSLT